MLQINILKIYFSGAGLEGLYPRPKLVAMDPNSWVKINPCHKCVFCVYFLILLLWN